jgi:hypothetical protein
MKVGATLEKLKPYFAMITTIFALLYWRGKVISGGAAASAPGA